MKATTTEYADLTIKEIDEVQFADIFDIEDLQRMQDMFSDATGVASVISMPDGRPITRPSNFCRLCSSIIGNTEKGAAYCRKSNIAIASPNPDGPMVHHCLSGGLWDAAASISVGGRHIANWKIGQVRDEMPDEKFVTQYAAEIGADKDEFLQALNEVPVMTSGQFKKVATMLYTFANQLSEKAYTNLQLKLHIAEREKIASLVQKSESRFRNVLQDVQSVSVQGYGPDGTTQYWNHASEILYGYTAQEAIGQNLLDLIIPDEMRENVAQAIRMMAETGQPIPSSELWLKRKDGSRVLVFSSHTIIQVPGRAQELFCVDIDLTQRRLAEEALRESEEKFRSITEQTNDFIAINDINGIITYASAASLGLFQYTPDEMCGHVFTDFLIESDIPKAREAFRVGIDRGQNPKNLELTLVRKDGSSFVGELNGTKFLSGSQNGTLVVIHDVSERKKAEETLFNERLLLRTLIDNIPDAIYAKDLAFRKTLANLAEVHLLGEKSEADVLGKDDFVFYSAEFADRFLADDLSVIQSGIPIINREGYLFDENGQKRWMLSSKLPLRDANNKVIGLVGIGRDITSRRLAEVAMRESQEKYRLIFVNSPMGLLSFDEKGIITACNNSFARIVGSTISELIGLNMLGLPDKKMVAVIQKALDGSNGIYEGVYHSARSAKSIPGRALFAPMDVGDGRIRGGVGIIEDITERKLAEMALKLSEEKYRTIFENVQDVFFQTDLFGIVLEISPSIKHFTEFNRDEIVGTPVTNIYYYPADRDLLLNELMLNGELRDYELAIKTRAGEKRYVSINARLIADADGKPSRIDGALRDITERKLSEEKIRKIGLHYQALIEKAPDGIVLLNAEGDLSFVSPAAKKMFGFHNTEKITGKPVDLTHPDDRCLLVSELARLIKDPSYVPTLQYRFLDNKGNWIWVESTMSNLLADASVEAIVINFRDITERRQADADLRESEERHRTILQTAMDGFWLVDMNGKLLEVNEAYCRMSGYSANELLAMCIPDLEAALSEDGIAAQIQNAVDMGESRFETQHRHKNGSIFDLEVSVKYQAAHGGRGVVFLHDISSRKQAELETLNAKDKAEASEFKVRGMFDNTLTGFVFLTCSGQILEANPAAISMLGSPSLEATRQINALTFPALIDNGFSRDIINCITGKKVITNESTYTSRWGKVLFIKYFLIPITHHDETIGVWANLQDLTDLWLTQTDLIKAKERAEESDRLKSAFLANMSHEIRTPMNGILGFAELLKEPGLSGEDQQEYIEIIEKSGMRMLNIINDIVDISKIEAGLMKVSLSNTNVNDQIEYVCTFFKPEFETKGLKLSCNASLPPVLATIMTDREKLYAILINLVKNALKYSDTGSVEFGYTPKIFLSPVQSHHGPTAPGMSDEPDHLLFYVTDTGIGIPVNRQKAIFDRFIQADIADKRAFQGAGLGLSITKAYVEMLGGKIWVESEEGKGSTFYFTLPVK